MCAQALAAQTPIVASHNCRFVMVPMRDGVKLNTSICEPRSATGPVPFLITRTPYGISGDTVVAESYRFLASDGYIFVGQDIRGRYRSEGQFVMNRPLRDPADPKSVDETTDTYDTVEWLTKNVTGHNGRAGVLGVSYPGFLAMMAGINPHPAVKAVSPQAPMIDTWMGDDFFHQGAFRLSYGFEYAGDLEMSKDGSWPLPIPTFDTYDWYLNFLPVGESGEYFFRGKVPTWRAFVAHPAYDIYWQRRAVQKMVKAPAVATLVVGGWWDQEDRFGPLATYAALEAGDAAKKNFLVMGPWNHGGWRRPERRMPIVDPGTNEEFLRDIEAPWFAYWLKDQGRLSAPEARVYDAGTKEWRSYDSWPPRGAARASLFLHGDGTLSFASPKSTETQFDEYVSDPAHPIPYRLRPIERTYGPGSRWRTWETEDQRFVHNRPDVVSWVSAPLGEDLGIVGDVVANIVASTTGRDADWVVKLIDVFPDSVEDEPSRGGYQLMVAHEIMRGRYRTSFSAPEPLKPNTPLGFTVDLHQQSYTFRARHRIMVQIQSSWFPLYDRNPQKWVDNIFEAKEKDFERHIHRIWHTPQQQSRIDVMIRAKSAATK